LGSSARVTKEEDVDPEKSEPEHEWFRVTKVDDDVWTVRDRLGDIEGLATSEVAMSMPQWPEEGE
jgi:hypothetical protein